MENSNSRPGTGDAPRASGEPHLKVIATFSALIAIGALGLAAWQYHIHRADLARLDETGRQRSQTDAEVQRLKAALADATKRADAEAADNTKLLAAIAAARTAKVEPPAVSQPITHDTVQARYRHAQELARAGNWEQALPELLWCFDEGMVRIPSFTGVRASFLLGELGRLAQNYPPARAALEERLAAAERRMNASATDGDAASDFAAINHYLGNDAATLAVYEKLPADDPRRRRLAGVYLYDVFVEKQRYAEAAQTRSYGGMLSTFTAMQQTANRPNSPAIAQAALRRSMVQSAAKNLEVLAGTGDLANAREFAAKVLAFDNSPETLATLQAHAARAGHPEVVEPTPKQ